MLQATAEKFEQNARAFFPVHAKLAQFTCTRAKVQTGRLAWELYSSRKKYPAKGASHVAKSDFLMQQQALQPPAATAINKQTIHPLFSILSRSKQHPKPGGNMSAEIEESGSDRPAVAGRFSAGHKDTKKWSGGCGGGV